MSPSMPATDPVPAQCCHSTVAYTAVEDAGQSRRQSKTTTTQGDSRQEGPTPPHFPEKNPLDNRILPETLVRRRTAIPTVGPYQRRRRHHRELPFPNRVRHGLCPPHPGEPPSSTKTFA